MNPAKRFKSSADSELEASDANSRPETPILSKETREAAIDFILGNPLRAPLDTADFLNMVEYNKQQTLKRNLNQRLNNKNKNNMLEDMSQKVHNILDIENPPRMLTKDYKLAQALRLLEEVEKVCYIYIF